jgi:hypothetical protein
MRARCTPIRVGRMASRPEHVHIDVDLEIGADPIRGLVRHGTLSTREFQGWIELAAALEAARSVPSGLGLSREPSRASGGRPRPEDW